MDVSCASPDTPEPTTNTPSTSLDRISPPETATDPRSLYRAANAILAQSNTSAQDQPTDESTLPDEPEPDDPTDDGTKGSERFPLPSRGGQASIRGLEALAARRGWDVSGATKERAVVAMDRLLDSDKPRDQVRAAQTLTAMDRCDIARAATQSDRAIALERLALDGARLALDTLAVRQQLVALAAAVAQASLPPQS